LKLSIVVFVALALSLFGTAGAGVFQEPGAKPVVVVETLKGSVSFELFADEAPRSVAHVLELVRVRFYDGQRIHRAIPGFVVQFGDPQTRDLTKRDLWGRGASAASGKPIGVAEIPRKPRHVRGSVGLAHPGNPANADSQLYIALEPRPDLDGHYAVIGQLIAGMELLPQFEIGDEIRRVYVRP
jgi:cyclophilin family peptidyl-prolyl cis-trans isomerase